MEKYQDQPETVVDTPNPRADLLQKALKIVTQDRNAQYGDPEDNFAKIAEYWNGYLRQRFSRDNKFWVRLQPHDVAILMVLMKVARLAHSPFHEDSWEDIAGYAACGFDCTIPKER